MIYHILMLPFYLLVALAWLLGITLLFEALKDAWRSKR